MKEYIDKEATIESLNQLKPFVRGDSQKRLMRRVIREVSCIPAADVKYAIHSKWEITEVDHAHGSKCYHCPECGEDDWRYNEPNFCPNCGADMRGEKHEAD